MNDHQATDQEAARLWLEQMQVCLDEAVQRFNVTTPAQELGRWLSDPF